MIFPLANGKGLLYSRIILKQHFISSSTFRVLTRAILGLVGCPFPIEFTIPFSKLNLCEQPNLFFPFLSVPMFFQFTMFFWLIKPCSFLVILTVFAAFYFQPFFFFYAIYISSSCKQTYVETAKPCSLIAQQIVMFAFC